MVRSLRAVYEDGVFRPLDGVDGLPERTAVRLRVEEMTTGDARLSDFAGRWSAEDADAIARVVESEFERVDPREW